MISAVGRRPRGVLALGVICAVALSMLLGAAPRAEAGTSVYCNNITLGGSGYCAGAPRTHYAVYGWGDQHSACVFGAVGPDNGPYTSYKCSGGPEQGVYNPYGFTMWLYPKISNNAAGNNTVHGVAYQP
jgi:hypothetical protein